MPSSSPVFYPSSPANRNDGASETPDVRMPESSSPVKSSSVIGPGDRTPRGDPGMRDTSPIRYMPISNPARQSYRDPQSDIFSSSSLFISNRAPGDGHRIVSRRSDINSGGFGSSPSRQRRLFVDANGMPAVKVDGSDATFSNINPDTSDADALAGNSGPTIWGTTISLQDCMSAFKNFLYNFTTKYRLWAEGATEDETRAMGDAAEEREYITLMKNMRQLGVTSMNLDVKNLKSYPASLKLWYQLHAYPQEIIPVMDQGVREVMVELAIEEMELLRTRSKRYQSHRNLSSTPAGFSSDAMNESGRVPQTEIPDLVAETESTPFKVLPFGLDSSVNMRDLDPAGTCIILNTQRNAN